MYQRIAEWTAIMYLILCVVIMILVSIDVFRCCCCCEQWWTSSQVKFNGLARVYV